MGDPKKRRKKFERPRMVWNTERISEEKALVKEYGLKNLREVWSAKNVLKKKRQNARKLLALNLEEREKREKELLESLIDLGVLKENASLENVLVLTAKDLLERRLETIVFRKGLALSIGQARQFIVHGHIAVDSRKVSSPGFIVRKSLEDKVSYYGKPIVLEVKKKAKDLRKEFEEVKTEGAKNE